MIKRLYESIPDVPPGADWDRESVVKEHYGVWFESHCSGDCPMYILTTHVVTAPRGCPQTLDLPALAIAALEGDWDGKLARALAVLEVTPTAPGPAWLLASDWG